MSSVRLLRDHKETIQDGAGSRVVGGAKGDVISVPFTVRNQMLKKGIAADHNESPRLQQADVQPDSGLQVGQGDRKK